MHLQHSDSCSCALQDYPQNPAYPKKILCYALVDIVRSEQKVQTSELRRRLQEYIPWELKPWFVTNTKKAAQALVLSNSSSCAMCARLSPTKTAQAQNAMLYQYIHQLRTIGHKVTATTQVGSALRKFVVDAALKAHKEHQKKKQPQDRAPFDPELTITSDFYVSIDPEAQYLHSVMICPTTAAHHLHSTRRVASADWAHVKGWIGGNMFSLVANDANHHVCHLVIGYVAGNETAESWKTALNFAKQNLPSFDDDRQVLLTDGSKGAADAMSTFDHAHYFLCSNHQNENAKKLKKDDGMLYNQCVQATSMVELRSLLSMCDARLHGFIAKHPLHMQFPIALLDEHCISLHGVTTTNSVESVNHSVIDALLVGRRLGGGGLGQRLGGWLRGWVSHGGGGCFLLGGLWRSIPTVHNSTYRITSYEVSAQSIIQHSCDFMSHFFNCHVRSGWILA